MSRQELRVLIELASRPESNRSVACSYLLNNFVVERSAVSLLSVCWFIAKSFDETKDEIFDPCVARVVAMSARHGGRRRQREKLAGLLIRKATGKMAGPGIHKFVRPISKRATY